jgi:hypothetical protein
MRRGFTRLRNLLICTGMTSRLTAPQVTVPAWHCRICGSVPVLQHTRRVWGRRKRFGIAWSESAPRLGLGRRRAIPSLRILCSRVACLFQDVPRRNGESPTTECYEVGRTSAGALRVSLMILMFVLVLGAVLLQWQRPRMAEPIFSNSSEPRHCSAPCAAALADRKAARFAAAAATA